MRKQNSFVAVGVIAVIVYGTVILLKSVGSGSRGVELSRLTAELDRLSTGVREYETTHHRLPIGSSGRLIVKDLGIDISPSRLDMFVFFSSDFSVEALSAGKTYIIAATKPGLVVRDSKRESVVLCTTAGARCMPFINRVKYAAWIKTMSEQEQPSLFRDEHGRIHLPFENEGN